VALSSRRAWSACARFAVLAALAVGVLGAAGSGCGGSCGGDSPAAGARGGKPLRCGDFLVVEEIRALGLDASRFDADLMQRDPALGVRCDLGKVAVTVFDGAQFPSLLVDLHAAVAGKQVLSHPGPKFGSDSHWTLMGKLHGLLFLSTSKRYAASLAGRDQALLENLAQQLDARLK
jgi:hypothetical protein